MNKIYPEKEIKKIAEFIKGILEKQNHKKVVIGLSGGIDSTVCLYLLRKVISPKNIIVTHLHYSSPSKDVEKIIKRSHIPKENVKIISIKKTVEDLTALLKVSNIDKKIRKGNIMARIRMIILYDIAKENNALVCGTENKSEHFLGYFTRFGDEASDVEPIRHLFKTEIYLLGKYLDIPLEIINKKPSAQLWKNQTDEKEFGFSYKEADQVLYLYFEKQVAQDIVRKKHRNAGKIIDFVLKNKFKHNTPYLINKKII